MYKTLSEKLSTLAAKRIAESGIPWSQARQELREENPSLKASDLPTDDQIETALREHYAVYDPQGHAMRLAELRNIAVEVMEEIAPFQPEIYRGVLNGCADEYSPICLLTDYASPKEIEIFLLDNDIDIEVMEPPPNAPGAPVEDIYFEAKTPPGGYFASHGIPVMVKLSVCEQPYLMKKKARKLPDPWQIEEETLRTANLQQLKKLIEKVSLSS
ncbi:MAG: hypothetical protein LUC43_05450 [Burkholderiales bacterium]|nr:hypothetical protein [Burkholderiales bacterium]